MINDLIKQIDEHLAWREAQGHKMAHTTFGQKVVKDSKLMRRLRAGGGITVRNMTTIQQWIADDRKAVTRLVKQQKVAA